VLTNARAKKNPAYDVWTTPIPTIVIAQAMIDAGNGGRARHISGRK
jgi:hypothetical protein